MTRSLSAREKIDDDAEHYCAIHSPPRRKKMLQDKVKTGIDKINSLKQIEQNKDMTTKYVNEEKPKLQVRLQRSASERIPNRNPSTLLVKKEKNQSRKIAINSERSEEQKKIRKDSTTKTTTDIKIVSPSPSATRRSVTPK